MRFLLLAILCTFVMGAQAASSLECLDSQGNRLELVAGKSFWGRLTLVQDVWSLKAGRFGFNFGYQFGRQMYPTVISYQSINSEQESAPASILLPYASASPRLPEGRVVFATQEFDLEFDCVDGSSR